MIVVFMGVSGAGKTTIGKLFARKMGWMFFDGDDFQPEANIEKMKRGVPLKDADRIPWLQAIRKAIDKQCQKGRSAVFACSALKESYRQRLEKKGQVQFVYLKGSPKLVSERMKTRSSHFFPAGLLASQFADLEEPVKAIVLDIRSTPEDNVFSLLKELGLSAVCKEN